MTKNLPSNLSYKQNKELYDQISNLLIQKSIDCMDYSCSTDINISFGKYIWCGNMNSPTGSGFTLTNSDKTDIYGPQYKYMLYLNLKFNLKLKIDAEFIDIYSHDGFLFNYNIQPLKGKYTCFTNLNTIEDAFGTELKIVFSKKKKLTKEEQNIVNKRMFRIPREEIYSFKVKIPELKQFGDTENCNICLENVDENKYISPCGHLLHMNCIFNYLESKELLYEMHPNCLYHCCGAKKIKPFECVVCKTLIIK